MTTLVFGKNGQVAQALREFFPEAAFIGQDEANFERRAQVLKALDDLRPQLVINAAAYNEVDKAEIEPGRAMMINAETPGDIAYWCKENGASFIHYSTDYVFSGEGDRLWTETDVAQPVNRYGQSKLAGENEIASTGCHHYILRTSWVFSPRAQNFLATMARFGRERETVRVVSDQISTPTYARDLARATAALTRHKRFNTESGIFHATSSGPVSRLKFAEAIFAALRESGATLKVKQVVPVTTFEFKTPAKRPLRTALDTSKLKQTFAIELGPWNTGLKECFAPTTQG